MPRDSAAPATTVRAESIAAPASVRELKQLLTSSEERVVLRGAGMSRAVWPPTQGALVLDLSALNQVVRFEPVSGLVRVQAGMRWRDLQSFLGPHGCIPRMMPWFLDESVGGSVASNALGLGVGVGALGHSVTALRVMLADGTELEIGPQEEPHLFAAVVGGGGGVAIILEVELVLERNEALRCRSSRIEMADYLAHFEQAVQGDAEAVLHLATLHAPEFRTARVTTWVRTAEQPTHATPLRVQGDELPLRHLVGQSDPGSVVARAWQRRVVEPLAFGARAVHWRSFEASQLNEDWNDPEVEIQEFVVGRSGFDRFMEYLRAILADFEVRVEQLTVRNHGLGALSWLRLAGDDEDAFAVRLVARVAYDPDHAPQASPSVWSWALIDAALECGGTFNPFLGWRATREQFEQAFPDAAVLLDVKLRRDPLWRLGNAFWDTWLAAPQDAAREARTSRSEFRAALGLRGTRERLFDLTVTGSPRGEGYRLFAQLENLTGRTSDDELVYASLLRMQQRSQGSLWSRLRAPGSDWALEHHRRLARPLRQRLDLLPGFDGRTLQGVAELGSSGQQVEGLRGEVRVADPVVAVDTFGSGLLTQLARSGWSRGGASAVEDLPRARWDMTAFRAAPRTLSVVLACHGLNSLSTPALQRCLEQVSRALRPGGIFMLVEFDVDTAQQGVEASVALTLLHLCVGAAWSAVAEHPRTLRAADEWVQLMERHGLVECHERERLPRCPVGDVLLTFRRLEDQAEQRLPRAA